MKNPGPTWAATIDAIFHKPQTSSLNANSVPNVVGGESIAEGITVEASEEPHKDTYVYGLLPLSRHLREEGHRGVWCVGGWWAGGGLKL